MISSQPLTEQLTNPLPKSFGGCGCDCHRIPNVYHCMPCCSPSKEDLVEVVKDSLLPFRGMVNNDFTRGELKKRIEGFLGELKPPASRVECRLDGDLLHVDIWIPPPLFVVALDAYHEGPLSDGGFLDNPYLDVKGKEVEMRRWIDGKVQEIIDKRKTTELENEHGEAKGS